jgi:hypothetical protein
MVARWFALADQVLRKVAHDETRTRGLVRLELIRFPQIAQTKELHHASPDHCLADAHAEGGKQRLDAYRDGPG